MVKITKDTTLAEILKYPKAQAILAKYKLPCLGCPFAELEMDKLKLGEICKMYNINLKALLKELNEVQFQYARKN
jgi:hybrid cluster-associated redox disulfide protein